MNEILFYETNKAYGCFSNFSRHPIEIDGLTWLTSEHFFQAAKFIDQVDIDDVMNAPTPFLAAKIGRERQRSFRQDWEQIRDGVMTRALQAKFDQHADIREILLSTSGARLIEHTSNDRYWADGGDGTGRNMLGVLLEKIRSQLGPAASVWCVPPWVYEPDIEDGDMFWRMGRGEGHLIEAYDFHKSLGMSARKHYEMYFPVPAAWGGSWNAPNC